MSYSQGLTETNYSPFAMLTRSTYLAGDAQWNTQSQTWVSSSNAWQGSALVVGMATALSTGNQIIASTKFSSQSSRYTFANQWSANAVTRVSQDDVMIAYGSAATWATDSRFGGLTFSMHQTRARCLVMRVEQ